MASRFEELDPKGKKTWKAISLRKPSDSRDQVINRTVKPADRGIIKGFTGKAAKTRKK